MNVLNIKLLTIVILVFGLVVAQDDPFEGYVCDENDQTNITIGKNVTLCIHFKEKKKRMLFRIKVDEYSVISIGGGYSLAFNLNEETSKGQSFLAQVGKNTTFFPSLYLKRDPVVLIPLFNLVIKVNEGTIYDIVWDNACFSCEASDLCFSEEVQPMNQSMAKVTYNNCKNEVQCLPNDDTSFGCDPKFYITWFGTDANKRQLKTSNLAMSKFKQYSIGSLYNSAKGVFNSTLEDIKKSWDEVKKAIAQITS